MSYILILAFVVFIPTVMAAELRIVDHTKGDTYGQQFGDRVEGLGDINGDGYGDFLVTEFTARKLHLYLGGPQPFDNPPVITWENHDSPTGMKSSKPMNVGDVDCDGINDFIAVFGDTFTDTLKLFLGMESLNANDFHILFADSVTNDNYWRCGGGDNNNDGNPEFWIFRSLSGDDTLRGYIGCDLLDTIPDFKVITSRAPDNQYQVWVELCNTCDLNNDLIPEVIYAQPADNSAYSGRICIIWGGTELSTEPDLVFYAPYEHDGNSHFGCDFACLNDISGDGIDDIWISQGGRNYIYFGGMPFDTIPDIGLDWPYVNGDLVENIGDINHDGYNDIMLSQDGYLMSNIAFIYCYPGMDTLIDASWSDGSYELYLADGPICCMGEDHSWAGDIDGDGIDDVLLAPREVEIDYNDRGRVLIQAGWDEPVAVDDEPSPAVPQELELNQNRPNPFNSGTIIEFTLPRAGYTEVTIFNLLGEVVATPLSKTLSAGEHQIHWDGRDLDGHRTPTGVYFYNVTSDEYSKTRKMTLLK